MNDEQQVEPVKLVMCPECGEPLHMQRHIVHGIETYVPECDSCDYVGEPE